MNQQALIAKRADHHTAHLLHLVLSFLTAGMWVPVWIMVAISHACARANIDRQLRE